MVKYIPMYDAFVQKVCSSETYKSLSEQERKETDSFLVNKEVRKYFNGRVIAQLNLHESIALAFANSEILSQRTQAEQSKIMGYLNSKPFKKIARNIEKRLTACSEPVILL